MNEEDELFKKCFMKTLKKLAEEPDEVINYYEQLKKYNNLLKENIKLQQELQRKDNVINELEEFIKDWQNDLEIQSESVDGLDLFEKHAQIVLDDIMTRFNELRGK